MLNGNFQTICLKLDYENYEIHLTTGAKNIQTLHLDSFSINSLQIYSLADFDTRFLVLITEAKNTAKVHFFHYDISALVIITKIHDLFETARSINRKRNISTVSNSTLRSPSAMSLLGSKKFSSTNSGLSIVSSCVTEYDTLKQHEVLNRFDNGNVHYLGFTSHAEKIRSSEKALERVEYLVQAMLHSCHGDVFSLLKNTPISLEISANLIKMISEKSKKRTHL